MTDAVPAAAVPAPSPAAPEKPKGPGGHALDWWRYHCDPGRPGNDPGTPARLRRCDSSMDAATIPAAVSLARRLGAFVDGVDDRRITTGLDLARVLAHVREHAPGPPMRAAGWKSFPGDRAETEAGEDRPRLSEVRFRHLITTGGGEEQVAAFRRLIALLDGAVDVARLAADFLAWSHPSKGEQVRKEWAVDYYAARPPRPVADPSASAPTSLAEDDA